MIESNSLPVARGQCAANWLKNRKAYSRNAQRLMIELPEPTITWDENYCELALIPG